MLIIQINTYATKVQIEYILLIIIVCITNVNSEICNGETTHSSSVNTVRNPLFYSGNKM